MGLNENCYELSRPKYLHSVRFPSNSMDFNPPVELLFSGNFCFWVSFPLASHQADCPFYIWNGVLFSDL